MLLGENIAASWRVRCAQDAIN